MNQPFQIQKLFIFNIKIITTKTDCTWADEVNYWNLLQSPETVPHLEEAWDVTDTITGQL